MKKKISEMAKEELKSLKEKKLTRKEAIKRSGFMALSAATLMMLLPTQGMASSPGSRPAAPTNDAPNNPGGIWDD